MIFNHSRLGWIAAVSCAFLHPSAIAEPKSKKKQPQPAEARPAPAAIERKIDPGPAEPNATIATAEIREFPAQPGGVRKLIESCLALTARNLTYTFGSADPERGGLDCSGFVYYVLREHGFAQVPRDARGIYAWARRAGKFRAVVSRKADSFEFDELLPGDLLFWTGTYALDQDPPVSHVMIYLGTEKSGGGRIMAGSSDGRSYRGKKRNGASVFDFTLPRADSPATFIGYARIPGLRD